MIRFQEGFRKQSGAYLNAGKSKPETLADACHLLYIMNCLHRAAIETGTWSWREFEALGHCILACSALIDVLRALGRSDAVFHRCGLNLTVNRGEQIVHWETIGHPGVKTVAHLWNSHMTVRVGTLLADPTFGQIQTQWSDVPVFAIFDRQHKVRERFLLAGAGRVDIIASARWQKDDRTYISRHFRLPRQVDRATKRWLHRPDAQPARRAALVARTLELVRHDLNGRRSGMFD